MLDSIQGSADASARMPMSDKLRAPGRTPSTASNGAFEVRQDAAFASIGITRAAVPNFAGKAGGKLAIQHQAIELRLTGGCGDGLGVGPGINDPQHGDTPRASQPGIFLDKLMLRMFRFGPGANAEGDQQAVDGRALEQTERGGVVPLSESFASLRWGSLAFGAPG